MRDKGQVYKFRRVTALNRGNYTDTSEVSRAESNMNLGGPKGVSKADFERLLWKKVHLVNGESITLYLRHPKIVLFRV